MRFAAPKDLTVISLFFAKSLRLGKRLHREPST